MNGSVRTQIKAAAQAVACMQSMSEVANVLRSIDREAMICLLCLSTEDAGQSKSQQERNETVLGIGVERGLKHD